MKLALVCVLALLVAGCVNLGPGNDSSGAPVLVAPVFGAPKILDPVRSGGEPVLFQSPKGTLFVAAHPGFTHIKAPPGPEVITPANGQSYLYRSTDGGATWSVITGAGNTPRNGAPGDSDPDLAVTPDGKLLVMAQLDGFGISSEASSDDGATWPGANALVADSGDGSVDRPWVAYANDQFYLLYNGDNNGHWRMKTSKDGVSWTDFSTPGDGSYPGAIVAAKDGSLYIGNGDKVWSSTDKGKTFAATKIPGQKPMTGITAQRPAVDDNGTVYFAWSETSGIYYAASHDHGATWGPAVSLTSAYPGTHIWPWPAAGAQGDLAVVWVGTSETNPDPSAVKGDWVVYEATITGADTATPRIASAPIAAAKVTTGGICIDGTICEAEAKDRRLGDFITVIIDLEGNVHIAYGTTTTGHSISSPAYVKQMSGTKLR